MAPFLFQGLKNHPWARPGGQSWGPARQQWGSSQSCFRNWVLPWCHLQELVTGRWQGCQEAVHCTPQRRDQGCPPTPTTGVILRRTSLGEEPHKCRFVKHTHRALECLAPSPTPLQTLESQQCFWGPQYWVLGSPKAWICLHPGHSRPRE